MHESADTKPLEFFHMDTASAREILTWLYEAPYDVYNLSSDNEETKLAYLLYSGRAFYRMLDETGMLVAFCSFGQDGQVAGGDYQADAVDIGMGMRPDLTGGGRGGVYINTIVDFARRTFTSRAYRVTIAAFTTRAQRAWRSCGFQPVHTFQRTHDDRQFVIFLREEVSTKDTVCKRRGMLDLARGITAM